MTEQITSMEIAKAAHNLERLAEFIGVRRRWTLAKAGHSPAEGALKAGEAIAEMICEMTGEEIVTPVGVEQPSDLKPAGEVSAGRLARFADYLDQLRQWFEAHAGMQLPSGSEDHVRSIQRSLAATGEALSLLLEDKAPEPEPQKDLFSEPEPLTRADLGPVAKVDANARLILDHTWQKSLLQKRDGILRLTPKTAKMLDTFFADQSFELNSHERRRLYEKIQRWIESTPNGRVLVLRVSGLSGKPDVLSSFQPKEGEGDLPVATTSMFETTAADDSEDKPSPDEKQATEPAEVAPQAPVVDPEEEFVLPDPIEEPKKKSHLEEYLANPPSGVMPKTIAPPKMDDSSEKDTKDDE